MAAQLDIVKEINSHVNEIKRLIDKLAKLRDKAAKVEEMRAKAIQYSDNIMPAMAELREHADRLELLVADDLWPLPKYRELLFIR